MREIKSIRIPLIVFAIIYLLMVCSCSTKSPAQLRELTYSLNSIASNLKLSSEGERPYIVVGKDVKLAIQSVKFASKNSTSPWEARVMIAPHRPTSGDDCWDMEKAFVSSWIKITPVDAKERSGGDSESEITVSKDSGVILGCDALMIALEVREAPDAKSDLAEEIEVAVLPEDTPKAWAVWNISRNSFNSASRNRRCAPSSPD